MVKVTDDPQNAEAGDITSDGDIWCRFLSTIERNSWHPTWVKKDDLNLYSAFGWEENTNHDLDGGLTIVSRAE